MARLSQSLSLRADRGELPAVLGRADIENFLNRLAYQQAQGQLSVDTRRRTWLEIRKILDRVRALGLTRPGQVAAGLGEDFVLTTADIPRPVEAEPDGDLPPEIMTQLCTHLPALETVGSIQIRVAVELLIDTGRRPGEICGLDFDCLDRAGDGKPVLIYNNDKMARMGRRLRIGQATAAVITASSNGSGPASRTHQSASSSCCPPATTTGRAGTRSGRPPGTATPAVAGQAAHRTHRRGQRVQHPHIVPYAYRHTFAQRHADAGVPVDVLRDLMNHKGLDATKKYYRIGETRRREAIDRMVALQFDRHGNRTWRDAKTLLDSEHARRAVGEGVVPFGVCAEPSNVQAGGHACPYRYHCVGCDHFRTDASYLPDPRVPRRPAAQPGTDPRRS